MNKTRNWVAVCYPENMVDNWENLISDLLQLPFCYCVHDKDIVDDKEGRKTHVHIMIVFNNTTTYKHALETFDMLSASGRKCVNTCEPIINVKFMYDYLIHDTDSCKKLGKHLYTREERICGNNFDIGSLVQLSTKEKNDILFDLVKIIRNNYVTNFADFYYFIFDNSDDYDTDVFEVVKTNSGFLERLIKGNYLKLESVRNSKT